jgi:hypothetical protein
LLYRLSYAIANLTVYRILDAMASDVEKSRSHPVRIAYAERFRIAAREFLAINAVSGRSIAERLCQPPDTC